jgi:NAD(P)-dependent dehydrogenase (short-subunit alcohol dehydrogenase family)
MKDLFDLSGRVIVITGGAGLLGRQHGAVVAAAGGIPVVVDLDRDRAEATAKEHAERHNVPATGLETDITDPAAVRHMRDEVIDRHGRIDGLINNAANNPKVEGDGCDFSRLESFTLRQWTDDVAVGLTGSFLCCQVIGSHLAAQGRGSIVNISSEYGMLGPDQRLYRRGGVPDDQQPVKPISYSVTKAGLDGMTRWLATYWGERGVRVNTLTVGGIENGQPSGYLVLAASRIPLGRMARVDEYQGAIAFRLSDASSFMPGANLVIDGGKSTW